MGQQLEATPQIVQDIVYRKANAQIIDTCLHFKKNQGTRCLLLVGLGAGKAAARSVHVL